MVAIKRQSRRQLLSPVILLPLLLLISAGLVVAYLQFVVNADIGSLFSSFDDLPPAAPSAGRTIFPVDCTELLKARNASNIDPSLLGNIQDPNKIGEMYTRYTDTDPRFWVSLHSQEFDSIRFDIIKEGTYYERKLTLIFGEVLKSSPSNSRVLDVGGNVGWYTLYGAAHGFHVDSFEPNILNRFRLCEAIGLNKFKSNLRHDSERKLKQPSVNVYRYGVGEKDDDTMPFFMPNSGMGTFRKETDFSLLTINLHKEIPMTSLDRFAKEVGIFDSGDPIAILKVDVEGFEPKVFKGASKLLASKLVKNIFMEFTSHSHGMDEEWAMVDFLLNSGYELHQFGKWSGPNNPFPKEHKNNMTGFLTDKCMTRPKDQCNLWWKPVSDEQNDAT